MTDKKDKHDKQFFVLSEQGGDDSVECLFYYPFDTAEVAIKAIKEADDLNSETDIIYIVQVVRKFKVKSKKVSLEEFT